jgi:hypothetical protein
LGDDLQTIWGFGAMCDGVAHLLLEPLGDGAWLDAATTIRATRAEGALVTVLDETSAGGTREVHECDPALRAALAPLVNAARHNRSLPCTETW